MDVENQLEWQVKEKCGNRTVKVVLERIQVSGRKIIKSHETGSSLEINPENGVNSLRNDSVLLSSESDAGRSRPQRNKTKKYAHYFDGGDDEVDIESGASSSSSGSDSEAEGSSDFEFESPHLTKTKNSTKAVPSKSSAIPKPQKNDHENRSTSLSKPRKRGTRKSPPRVVCSVCNLNIGKYKLRPHFKLKHPDEELPKATQILLDKNSRITCDFCPSSFAKTYIWKHIRIKHPERLTKHQEPREIKCDLCSLLLPVGKLYLHKKTQHPQSQVKTASCLQCDLCPYTCTTEQWLESHILQVHVVDKPSECDICFKAFLTEELLQEHVKRAHEDKNFNCRLCPSRSFQDSGSLKKHIETVHKVYNGHCCDESESRDTNSLCPVCETWFMTDSDLVQHLKKPESEPAMKCELCSEPVYTPCRLNVHRQNMHSDFLITDTSTKRVETSPDAEQGSPHSEKITEVSASVSASAKNPPVVTNKFSCIVCSAHFPRRCDLEFHELQEKHRRWKCPICSKLFKTKRKYLKAHMETVHSDARPFPCTLKGCGKEFKRMSNLTSHMAIHNANRVHCKDCLKYFPKKSFQVHVATRHEGNRKFVCDVCSKNWGTSSRLRQHMRSHTDERSWPCKFCDAMYKCSPEAKRHMKKCEFRSEDQRQRFARTSIGMRTSAASKQNKLKREKTLSDQGGNLHGKLSPKPKKVGSGSVSTNELSPCGTTSSNATLIKYEMDPTTNNNVTSLTGKAVEWNENKTMKSEATVTTELNCATTSFNRAEITVIKQELDLKYVAVADISADLDDLPEPVENVAKIETVLKQEMSIYSD